MKTFKIVLSFSLVVVLSILNFNYKHASVIMRENSLITMLSIAQAQPENTSLIPWLNADGTNKFYSKGPNGSNWKEYKIWCTYPSASTTTSNNWGGHYSGSVSAGAYVPNTPIHASASGSYSVYAQSSSTTTYNSSSQTVLKTLCGSGSGFCLSPSVSGNPCS